MSTLPVDMLTHFLSEKSQDVGKKCELLIHQYKKALSEEFWLEMPKFHRGYIFLA
jgi:hypothetical protein